MELEKAKTCIPDFSQLPNEILLDYLCPRIYRPNVLTQEPNGAQTYPTWKTFSALAVTCKTLHEVVKEHRKRLDAIIKKPEDILYIHKVLNGEEVLAHYKTDSLQARMFARVGLNKIIGHTVAENVYFSREDTAFLTLLALRFMQKNNYDINESFELIQKSIPPYNRVVKHIPLVEACKRGRKELVWLLLKYGANPNSELKTYIIHRKPKKITPLMVITEKISVQSTLHQNVQHLMDIKKMLLDAGAVENKKTIC